MIVIICGEDWNYIFDKFWFWWWSSGFGFFFFFFQKISRVVSFEHSETFFFFIHYHKSKEMTSRDFARAFDGGGLFFWSPACREPMVISSGIFLSGPAFWTNCLLFLLLLLLFLFVQLIVESFRWRGLSLTFRWFTVGVAALLCETPASSPDYSASLLHHQALRHVAFTRTPGRSSPFLGPARHFPVSPTPKATLLFLTATQRYNHEHRPLHHY